LATTQIKDGYNGGSDNQAYVDDTGHLYVTGTFTPGPGTSNVNIIQVGGAAITLGQNLMANSLPVTIASNQSTLNVAVTNFPATQPVSGTVTALQGTSPWVVSGTTTISGPVAVTQDTIPWSDNIAQYGGVATSLGQKVSASSVPVVIASDQSAINVVTSGTSTVSGTVNTNLNGLNAFATTQYLVGTSAVQVVIPSGTSSVGVKVKCTTSSDAVVVGNSNTVTNVINGTGNGYAMYSGDATQIDVTNSATMWLIGTSAGQFVYVLFAGG
jgi:hypothetical protein